VPDQQDAEGGARGGVDRSRQVRPRLALDREHDVVRAVPFEGQPGDRPVPVVDPRQFEVAARRFDLGRGVLDPVAQSDRVGEATDERTGDEEETGGDEDRPADLRRRGRGPAAPEETAVRPVATAPAVACGDHTGGNTVPAC
jgi:hypothetical protein